MLLFLITISAGKTIGQIIPIDSFYTPGTTWTQAVYNDDHWVNYHWHRWGAEGIILYIARDTTVAGTKYHLLCEACNGGYHLFESIDNPGVVSFSYYPPPGSLYDTFVLGRIRVDSNRVYFTQDYVNPVVEFLPLGVEYLLYDFNLSIGTSVITSGSENINVAGIDSVPLSNGNYIKKYIDSSGGYWLQGIGSIEGLFHYWHLRPRFAVYTIVYQEKLLCYDNPSFSYHMQYTDSILPGMFQYNCFDYSALSITNVHKENSTKIIVYPDPLTDDYLYFEESNPEQISSVTVFDISGRPVHTFQHPFLHGENQLYLPLQPGMYILKTEFSDHSTDTRKIIRL